ncbi:glycosyl hydrolase [Pseudoneurospora amorphoporcata]|uniref:alpha-1,2-Mannosidase n=1 Tax=Pseudoneurospora amorphoporcata TaxID=241081 RepID=A0AAN6NKP4_9PEZI|nr:glycosyl hydrolase [Pseudoneurospora amorphoporcata]
MNSSANSFSFSSRLRLFRRKMASSRHLRLVAGVACFLLVLFLVHPFDSPKLLTAPRPGGSHSLAQPVLKPSPSSRRKVTFKPSSFDWTKVEQYFPVELKHKLPTGRSKPQKPVQYDFSQYVYDPVTRNRQKLHDELAPVSGKGKTTFGGWGGTLVDALDTLWIMELWDDFYLAANAAAQLDWQNTTETAANMFETTIRHLGGLLSAYDLSGEQALLDKATELGNMLYMGFDTPNRMPGFWLNFEDAKRGPKLINFREERINGESGFTLGALADSLYEYLPKMHALLGGLSPQYEKMHRAAMHVVTKHMLFRPMLPAEEAKAHNILFVGDAFARPDRIDRVAEGQHLTYFTGGMFGLGGKLFDINEHVEIGERLARGCGWAYNAFPTSNEERWKEEGSKNLKKGFASARDARYILRPEAIESIFLLYRMTGKEDLRDLAWQMFESIVNATETELAYSAITDVTVRGPTTKSDSMESFWLAETLKYFYLIFSPPNIINLDEYVFNTEAHPFLRPKS